jgi:hypothetical protein
MDEDVKRRMMADLGLATRDLVSAPEERSKGNFPGNDAHKQAAVRQAAVSRRAQVIAATANPKDERAVKLRAWNSRSLLYPPFVLLLNAIQRRAHLRRMR